MLWGVRLFVPSKQSTSSKTWTVLSLKIRQGPDCACPLHGQENWCGGKTWRAILHIAPKAWGQAELQSLYSPAPNGLGCWLHLCSWPMYQPWAHEPGSYSALWLILWGGLLVTCFLRWAWDVEAPLYQLDSPFFNIILFPLQFNHSQVTSICPYTSCLHFLLLVIYITLNSMQETVLPVPIGVGDTTNLKCLSGKSFVHFCKPRYLKLFRDADEVWGAYIGWTSALSFVHHLV